MAYSGKITISGQQNNFVSAFSEFIRYICGDPSIPGRDWQIIFTELDTSSNNFQYISYSGTLNVNENNVWINLPTAFVTEYTFTRGGINLIENTDYELDWKLGRIKFLTGTPPYDIDYSYKFKRFRVVVKNTGLSGTENIYAGFLMVSSGYDKANILVRCYRGYEAGVTPFFDTTFGNPISGNYHPMFGFWTGAIDMWIFSNKQRIILVARNNTYYTFCYVGNIFRLCPPKEYPQPLWVQADLWGRPDLSSIIWYDSTDGNRRFLAMPRTNPGYMINFANQWSSNYAVVPTQTDTDNWITVAYIDGYDKVLFPLYFICDGYIVGMPDGFYYAPGLSLSAESEIMVGSDKYILFPNCWRTGYADWMAIKEE
jgi:hypothetical protein